MTTWKGRPIKDTSEMGAAGNIICIGPLDSVEKFLEPSSGKRYFDPEVYDNGWGGRMCDGIDVVDEENDIYRVQIALSFYSKLIPKSALNLRIDFPDCDFEIICEFTEGNLSNWWNVRNYRTIASISELLKQGTLDGHETMCGWLRLGKSFPNHVYEELQFDLDPQIIKRITVNQNVDIINDTIDINKSFFISE